MTPDTIVGTPEQITEILQGVIEQGAQRLTVYFNDAPGVEGTSLFARTVLPHIAA